MEWNNFVKERVVTETLPEGKTVIDFNEIKSIEPYEFEADGKKITRFNLAVGDKIYSVAGSVIDDLVMRQRKGGKSATITRQGQGLQTKYIVDGELPATKNTPKEKA